MKYIYVVTVGERGSEKVEFFGNPTAYEDQDAAELAARMCRESTPSNFDEVYVSYKAGHIIHQWDSDELSVWLERLVFEPKA